MRVAAMVRQGDVLLVPVEAPAGLVSAARQQGRLVLAEGELTGHAHVIESSQAELVGHEGAEELYLLVHGEEPVALSHEEHDTLRVEPGAYRVVRQREFVGAPAPSPAEPEDETARDRFWELVGD